MADSGKINKNHDFAKPGSPKPSQASSESSTPKSNPKPKTSSDIYKGSTNSQSSLLINIEANKSNKNDVPVSKLELPSPELDLKAKNPILFEQLKNSEARLPDLNKPKQAPPDPSLRVKLSPKGYPINPRKVKPHMPGRLNPFFDNGISALERLAMSLGEKNLVNVNNLYADSLLKDYMSSYQSSSIADLLNLEYTIFHQDTNFITDFLSARAELLAEDQFLYDSLRNIINILQQSHNPIQQILQLYLPFPLTFMVKDLDQEFENDETELKEDSREGKNQDSKEEEQEDEEDVDEVSISVTTLNFNKMHFLIRFLKSSNEVKIFIKGDSSSSEISIPIEMAIDDALYGEVDHLDFHNSLWRRPVPLDSKTRFLKIKHKGKIDSRMISVTRTILETIASNDYNEETSSDML
jgi:hypothetical protein